MIDLLDDDNNDDSVQLSHQSHPPLPRQPPRSHYYYDNSNNNNNNNSGRNSHTATTTTLNKTNRISFRSNHHHQHHTEKNNSSSKMLPHHHPHHDASTTVGMKQRPHRRTAMNNSSSNSITSTSSHPRRHLYRYLQTIMIFIAIATIFNIYTSSYILKQRILLSSFESMMIFPENYPFLSRNRHNNSSTSNKDDSNTPSSASISTPPHKLRRMDMVVDGSDDLNKNDDSWVLPISMIETVIRQSNDYQTTQQRRLVVCATNYEYLDFADNFVSSLIRHNVTNFVIVPLDTRTYHTIRNLHPSNTLPTFPTAADTSDDTNGSHNITTATTSSSSSSSSSARFGSVAFRQITASRPNILRQIIQQLNVTILYNDIDMVWKQNAWNVLDERIHEAQTTPVETLIQDELDSAKARRNTNVDDRMTPTTTDKSKTARELQTDVSSTTTSSTVTTLLWHDGPGLICTCIMYLTPTENNIHLLQEWEMEILQDTQGIYVSDQDAFIAYIETKQYIEQSQQMTTYAIVPSVSNGTTGSSTNTTTASASRVTDVPQHVPYMTILYRNDHEFPHGHKYNWYNHTTTTTTTTTIMNSNQTSNNNNNKKKDFLYNPKFAIIVHNNWIKGKIAKFQRFKISGLWNPSGLL